MKGKVKFYNEMKRFGFIAGDDGQEYFVHQSGLKEGTTIKENDAVVFDAEEGERGLKAVNVALDSGEDAGSDESEDTDDSDLKEAA